MNTIRKTLNENWRFHLGDCEPAWYKGFDDASWQEVSLPHDWSVTHFIWGTASRHGTRALTMRAGRR